MPHATNAYPFEWVVWEFAAALSARLTTGPTPRSFLLTLDPAGDVTALVFKDGTTGWADRVREAEAASTPHLFYDPLEDGVEYTWVSWRGIGRAVMERLAGRVLVAADFRPMPGFEGRAAPLDPPGQFPPAWGVMF